MPHTAPPQPSPVISRYGLGLLAALSVAGLSGCGNGSAVEDGSARDRAVHNTGQPLPGCADTTSSGGDWARYTLDDAHSRHQIAETRIGPNNVSSLAAAWTFQADGGSPPPDFNGVPIVSDGCVYLGSIAGDLYALNADTGELVWRQSFTIIDGLGQTIPGGLLGSVAVANGLVYAGLTPNYPGSIGLSALTPSALELCDDPSDGINNGHCALTQVVAVNQASGEEVWRTTVDPQSGSDIYGTPVIHNGLLFVGISGSRAETDNNVYRNNWQGSYVILDALSGELLKKHWLIHAPVSEGGPDDSNSGASVYSTLAIDDERDHGYWGVGATYDITEEHPITNTIIKVDLDRNSAHFGEILGNYRGDPEAYLEELNALPCVDLRFVTGGLGAKPPLVQGVGSCTNLNLDFGASVNLFPDPDNPDILLAGNGQKSGAYHIIDTATMTRRSRTVLNVPTIIGGILGNSGYDGEYLYGSSVIGGYLWSLNPADGSIRWLSPLADVFHWGPSVALANGVLYTVDFLGFFNAIDMATGFPLFKRPMLLDVLPLANALPNSWGSVTIARHSIFAITSVGGTGGTLIAYRIPGLEP